MEASCRNTAFECATNRIEVGPRESRRQGRRSGLFSARSRLVAVRSFAFAAASAEANFDGRQSARRDVCGFELLPNTGATGLMDVAPFARSNIGPMRTIGLIGAGHIGSQVARLAVAHGYDVAISNSRGPESLKDLVSELGPRARAVTVLEAATAGDVVVVTIPLKNYRSVPVEPLVGKIVIDTNNYYPQRDGQIPELDNESTTTAELLQAHLPTSKVVKAFNHIYASQLTTDGRPHDDPTTKTRGCVETA